MLPDIGFLLLAAGKSTRFGGHKLVATLDGRALWQWAAHAGDEVGFDRKLAVISPQMANIDPGPDWQKTVNSEPERGLSSSITIGVTALADCSRIVIALADMPFVSAGHLRQLASSDGVAFSIYPDGRRGIPAAFPQAAFARLTGLTGDRGASALHFPDAMVIAPPKAKELADIDTLYDLEQAQNAT